MLVALYDLFEILFAYAAIASTMAISRLALECHVSPFLLITLRMLIAGIGFLYFCKGSKIFLFQKRFKAMCGLAFFHIILPFNCEAWALRKISLVTAQFLYNLSPFITALLTQKRAPISRIQWGALMTAFFAATHMLHSMNQVWIPHPEDMIMLIAVISGAWGWILFKGLMEEGYSPVMLNGFSMTLGGVVSFGLFLLEGSKGVQVTNWPKLLGLIGILVGVANVLFYSLYAKALKKHHPTLLSLLGQFTPCFAELYERLLLPEIPKRNYMIALAIMITATWLFLREEKRWGRSDSN